jgi:sulfite exporter TauE/SafE/copper chaperone CopZ
MNKIKIPIRGMHCASCELLVSEQLEKIHGVKAVYVSQKRAYAEITYAGNRPNDKKITQAIQEAGYKIGDQQKLPWISRNSADYKDLAKAAIIILIIYFFAKWFGLFSIDVGASKSGVVVALLVGLVAGISTCMVLVGGLVLGLSARHSEKHPEATPLQKFRPHIYFNVGRILGYAVLGGIIGIIGKAFNPPTTVLGIITIAIGGVMIFFGLKLIEIFPILRDKSIALPPGIARLFGLQREVKEYSHRGALVMGALTFFIPCGFTQTMQLYAISTGSFWQGMAIMGLFALGTAPGLLGIGGLTSVFKAQKARLLFMSTGLAVIFLGWFNITNGSRLIGLDAGNNTTNAAVSDKQEQVVRMTQNARGYSPNSFTVEKGRPVKWIINSTSSFTCASWLVMREYGINRALGPGENILTFTPEKTGELPFSCSMGMYRGKFIVVDNKEAKRSVSNSAKIPQETTTLPAPWSCRAARSR